MNESALRLTLINGVIYSDDAIPRVAVGDRALAYGDGLFETMRVVFDQGELVIPLLAWHLKRFEKGIVALKLGSPSWLIKNFKEQVNQLLSALRETKDFVFEPSYICKVIVTRGEGGIGYAPPPKPNHQFISQILAAPHFSNEDRKKGMQVRICQHRLSDQPVLAGIKHLNRLDQVLASQELQGEQEGLMFDQDNCLVEGIKSNVLVFEGDKIMTPNIVNCGVKGTLRQWLLDHQDALGVSIEEVKIDALKFDRAEGIAMINSVFGLWPVTSLEGSLFNIHPKCATIQNHLHQTLGY